MAIAVISDVHGNLPALRAVIDDIRRSPATEIVSCGDNASGPMPKETIDYLRDLDIPFRSVQGNADRGAVLSFDRLPETDEAIHDDDIWTGRQLDKSHRDFLAGLPHTITLPVDGLGMVLFCHGTPRRDDEIVLETTPASRVTGLLRGVDADVVLCGHTHMQFYRDIAGVRLANVGSVGWAYAGKGAYWVLLDDDIRMQHTTYDLDAAANEMRRASSWPRLEAFLSSLESPPSREAALAAFEKVAGGPSESG